MKIVLLGSNGWGWRQFTTWLSASSSMRCSAVCRSHIKIWPQSEPLMTKLDPQKLASFICSKTKNNNYFIRLPWKAQTQFFCFCNNTASEVRTLQMQENLKETLKEKWSKNKIQKAKDSREKLLLAEKMENSWGRLSSFKINYSRFDTFQSD